MNTPNPTITCRLCAAKIQLSDYNLTHLITPHHRHPRTGKKCENTFVLIKIDRLQSDEK